MQQNLKKIKINVVKRKERVYNYGSYKTEQKGGKDVH